MQPSSVQDKDTQMDKLEVEQLAEARQQQHRPLVLIIEGNQMQRRLYDLVKDEVGMIPYIVQSSQEAVSAAEALDFNLIIIDLKMPDTYGLECAKQLQNLDRKRGTKTPTIAVTANAMLGDREKCMNAGMDDYLSKPFTLAELKQKISTWAA